MTVLSGPLVVFDHLDRLSDTRGLFEHAELADPRPAHGYCTDDVARGLVVVCREPNRGPVLDRLERVYLAFLEAAVQPDGACHNRMHHDGSWSDDPALGDWWGRAMWGLGVAAAHGSTGAVRARARTAFGTGACRRSPHSRAMAYAALGAAEILRAHPSDRVARRLLSATASSVPAGAREPGWPWPEPRLRYGNGTVAEALIVAGAGLNRPATMRRGIELLRFLLALETRDAHLSVTPVEGRGPGDAAPQFDQQPIEVAALADCCATAYRLTLNPRWLMGIRMAWNWFLGDNDSSVMMFDPLTGAGYDGLEVDGRNLNQGAESTLAMLSTAQHARSLRDLR